MRLEEFRSQLSDLAPAGCYVALRVGFYAPESDLNLFPKDWVDHYTLSGLALSDPLLRWCQSSDGCKRWSDIDASDDGQVMASYRSFGLRFGSVVSIRGTTAQPKRSLGLFARSDRDLHKTEMDEIRKIMSKLHFHKTRQLSIAQLEALRLFTQGRLQKQIADELGISVSAVKARLRSAADRLEVRTAVEAASLAVSRGIL